MHEYDDYERTNEELTLRGYNILIGLVLLWGFAINVVMCTFCTDIFMSWNFTAVVIGYFIVAFIGIMISTKSTNPFISFIGYNLVVVPVGVVLSIALIEFDQISIMNACLVTTTVTLILVVTATITPQLFLSMGQVLFACLSGVIVFEIIFLVIGITAPTVWDVIVALIFCGYIGYDWAKAQEGPHTVDNAIDSVVGLYLDIINLFLRVLSASSDSKSKGGGRR